MLIIYLLSIPFIAAVFLSCYGSQKIASKINMLVSIITFFISLVLVGQISRYGIIVFANKWFYVDHLSALLIVTTSFITMTTSLFSVKFLINEQNNGRISHGQLRFFYGLYQFFSFTSLLILTTNNLGILWVAMECATLITVLLIGLYHIPQSLEAAWKYLILCGLGLAQALLGTILFYVVAEQLSASHNMLLWTDLYSMSSHLPIKMVSIAFVFILVGYGTKAGLVPLHHWLPDVYGEGIAPVLSLMSGILLNLAFYAILRFKFITDRVTGNDFSNNLLLGFGLMTIVVAALFLLRQRDIKRLFAYSSIEHIGLICLAFGLNTPLALFAGLLHMTAHALTKSATFFSVGQVIQARNSSIMENIRGLNQDNPGLAWGLLLCVFFLIGMPPSAMFTSELLIIYSVVKINMWLVVPLSISLAIAFAAIIYQVQKMIFDKDEDRTPTQKIPFSLFPTYLHVVVIMVLGIFIPVALGHWFDQITQFMRGIS